MRLRTAAVLFSVCFLWGLGSARGEEVVISEIMYYPPGTNALDQWIEIANLGTRPVDLTGWTLSQGIKYAFPDHHQLSPGTYLVVAADLATFRSHYPDVTNAVGGWRGRLSRDGDTIQVVDASGRVASEVGYAAEGDWAARRLAAPDRLGRRGWEWFAPHKGLGSSLELVQSSLPAKYGQNWTSSTITGGTPGGPNSAARTNLAPILTAVRHRPAVPRSHDPVTVSVHLVDELRSGLKAALNWRLDGAADYASVPMVDDGLHGDGVAGDGTFGAVLPAQTNKSIVEFYLTAEDAAGNSRVYPNVIPPETNRTANLVYQVDDTTYAGPQSLLRLVMTSVESNYLAVQIWGGAPLSDSAVSGTFIQSDGVLGDEGGTQVRYSCGFRNRGHGTRSSVPHNFHVDLPQDQLWKGRGGLNLNTHYTHSQHLGSSIFRRLGIPMADSRPVQVRVNGVNLAKPGQEQFGAYAANETVDDRLVKRQFPLDPNGNLYRGIRDMIPGISADADLVWLGPSYTSYTNAYSKENNRAVNDWSDLLRLIDVLNHASDTEFVGTLNQIADVDQWMKYFAVNTLLDNQENSLANGSGDDFALYRGEKDSRFRLLAYDLDSVMGRGTRTTSYADGLWRMTNVAAINRVVKRPEYAPLYYQHLLELASAAFRPERMNPVIDQVLGDYVDATALANLKAFNASHVDYVLAQIPQQLSVDKSLPLKQGYPFTSSSRVTLSGRAPAALTYGVRVNGLPADYVAWQGAWSTSSLVLQPGLNPIVVQALDGVGQEVTRITYDVWYDDASVQTVTNVVSADTTWLASAGPFSLPQGLTVNAGATLTIEPGTSVYLGDGADFTVAKGGRLLAEGTPAAPIRFTVAPGSTARWGGLVVLGDAASPETRIAYAHFEGNGTTCIEVNGGTLRLDHATFGTTDHPYLSVDAASFLVSHCHFPAPTGSFEPLHGTGGIKTGGYGVVRHCYFGAPTGYNDVFDFTGGNRPDQPILQCLNNVFMGSGDDVLDLDGTDAWVQGNLFMHVHRNGSPDSSAAVSGGSSGGKTSEITVVGNLFFDCDNAATAKQGNFGSLLHNTIVRVTKAGGQDADSGVINLRDTTPDITTFGRGFYLEGNIVIDASQLARNYDPLQSTVTFTRNLLPLPWTGPGSENSVEDPRFVHVPTVPETSGFATWEEAQALRQWLSLQPDSPARGAGVDGQDLGGVIPLGVFVSGEPRETTPETTALLIVGPNRSGGGLPVEGFPLGSGYTHYRWRLDAGDWSGELPISTPLRLTNLANGTHQVEIVGKNDAGWYQNDARLGDDAIVTRSRVWTVDTSLPVVPSLPSVRLSEVFAGGQTPSGSGGATSDWVELHNDGSTVVDLSGMGLSDSVAQAYKFTFPPGTTLAAGGYLLVIGGSDTATPGLHLGFSLKASGDDLYLHRGTNQGGGLIDSVTFGLQIPDHSIGRVVSGAWALCKPTPAAANQVVALGDARGLRINEWLTDAQFAAKSDFVELFNPEPDPVALGGLFLSDAAGAPARHSIAPLSFISGKGCVSFGSGQALPGAHALSFKLSSEVGVILLSAADLSLLDSVSYGAQRTDVSQGRSPSGSDRFAAFATPTPGAPNPGTAAASVSTNIVVSVLGLMDVTNTVWRFDSSGVDRGTEWRAPNYNDSSWGLGSGLFGRETSPQQYPYPFQTTVLAPGQTGGQVTVYYRGHFTWTPPVGDYRLVATNFVDDGAVFYLNGVEVGRLRISANPVLYSSTASDQSDEGTPEALSFPADVLVPGDNVMAVEVHQTSRSSTDDVFGMSLAAIQSTTNVIAQGEGIPVLLNELLVTNRSVAYANSRLAGYVELHNPSTNTVSLEDLSLSNDPDAPRRWVFPPGSVIGPHGYQVISLDASAQASTTNTGFALSARGDVLYFFGRPTAGGALIDAIRFGLQTPDGSIGRVPDGIGEWRLARPTPATPNVAEELAGDSLLRINEWMADPSSGGDWFELVNTATRPAALAGLFVTDDLLNPTKARLAPLSFIGAGADGFVQLFADGRPEAGVDHVGFSLNKSGEAIGLFSSLGVSVDRVAFGPQRTGESQGRFPDGQPDIVNFPGTASPGRGNYLPTNGGVDSDGDGMEDAWEMRYFGSLSRDGRSDYDSDGMSDVDEFKAGSNPTDPTDALSLAVVSAGETVRLRFTALAGQTYTVQFRETLDAGRWERLADVAAPSSSGPVVLTDPEAIRSSRFYRVLTPRLP